MSEPPGRNYRYTDVCPRMQCQNAWHRMQQRAERAEAALRDIANPAYPCVPIDVAREVLEAGDE